jgi:hypothetical protein
MIMKIKYILLAAAVSVLPMQASYADDAHHPDKKASATAVKNNMKSAKGMMGNIPQHMKKMMQQMNDIRNTQDPDKRDRLIDEHMKNMQQGMKMMGGGMMGNDMMSGGMMGMSKMDMGKDKVMGTDKAAMQQRMNMMENKMNMMQGMMGQMMQSDAERVKTIKMRKR